MVDDLTIFLSLIKLVTVLAGLFVVWLGWRAYRSSRQRSILWLTLGMGVLTLGAVAEGIAFRGFGDLDRAHVIEAVFTAFGFGILVYSLYTK